MSKDNGDGHRDSAHTATDQATSIPTELDRAQLLVLKHNRDQHCAALDYCRRHRSDVIRIAQAGAVFPQDDAIIRQLAILAAWELREQDFARAAYL